jgi:hypothetical protein
MMLLGMGMGGIGYNQLRSADPLAALAMGIPDRGVGLPTMANTALGGGTATPTPLFAINNTTMIQRDGGIAARKDGVLKQPVINVKAEKIGPRR